ncbi:putative ABC transport system permease protein [Pedococcus dokdonensis]|uniref:Putative ABC transport system permease protein n=1 Tax=Pedococcus dokdonensis TaxID=443156 RepID=A0A1H0TBD2_9MICO|nr:ABC transporter permease [Pedococcus dokdonensis]SDP51000.1 putative ABC transport system permease protein [Pedococcus dokdonensis]
MTTLMEPQAPAGLPDESERGDVKSSRLSRWRASWRVALRMAKRDAWRYKGRSILVLVMVALPVGVLVATLVFATTSTVTPVERIPTSLGAAQAMVQGPDEQEVWQTADPDSGWQAEANDQPEKATPIPGFSKEDSLGSAANVAAVRRITGGTVVAAGDLYMRRVIDAKRSRGLLVTTVDATAVDLGSKAELVSGRWPTGDREIVATPYGVSRGLADHGTVTLRYDGRPVEVTVVGVANYFTSYGGQPDAVSARPLDQQAVLDWRYLVVRDTGVPYSEVTQWNKYGLRVTSAEALRHPPAESTLPKPLQDSYNNDARDLRVAVAVGGVMLLLVTTLLVAPAFAVSASRQRRTLALAASNGAETRQLRRKVLAQALLLGALAAVASAGLSILAVRGALGILQWKHPWTTMRYFQVSWWAVAAVIVMAVVSALVAALIPALRLRRLDIIGVMKGQSVSPRVNRVLPVIGAVLAVGGGVGLVAAVATKQREIAIGGLAIALTVGALLLVPMVLVLAGTLASRLPVAARMATRDAARHRTRSVPTVAAIMAGTIALTIFSIGLVSDTEQQRREYVPQLAAGDGMVYPAYEGNGTEDPGPSVIEPTEDLVHSLTPALVTSRIASVTVKYPDGPTDPMPFVTAVKPGCTVARAVQDNQFDPNGGPHCTIVGTNGQTSIAVLSATDLARLASLSSEQTAVLRNGGILVKDAGLVAGGKVTMASGAAVISQADGTVQSVTGERSAALPGVVGRMTLGQNQYGAAVTPETAARLGWTVGNYSLLLHDPDGAISQTDEQTLSDQLSEDGGFYVERGFQRDDIVVMRVMFGAFGLLLLIVTLISTALALAEQQSDMGTLAAVGATKGTRRRLAAAQSATVAFIGVLVGIGVGLAPGIAVTYPLTGFSYDPETGQSTTPHPITIIPWLPLSLLLVGVPLVAALLSAVAIRRAPAMTRRAD